LSAHFVRVYAGAYRERESGNESRAVHDASHSSAQLRAILEPRQINFARGYDSIGTIATIRTLVFLRAGKLDFTQLNPHARRMHVNPFEIQRSKKAIN
jgi:hypothetical protein